LDEDAEEEEEEEEVEGETTPFFFEPRGSVRVFISKSIISASSKLSMTSHQRPA